MLSGLPIIEENNGVFNDFINTNPQIIGNKKVTIISDPEGASIFIDGTYFGKSNMEVAISNGIHEIVLKKSGYQNYSDLINPELKNIFTVKLEK